MKTAKHVAAKVAREVMFHRAGMSASIPTWALAIANDHSIVIENVREALEQRIIRDRADSARRARHQAMLDCGLVRVRVNGKTFYE
jgi:hypothetical protein